MYSSLNEEWKSQWECKEPPDEIEMDFVAHTVSAPVSQQAFGQRLVRVNTTVASNTHYKSTSAIMDISPGKSMVAESVDDPDTVEGKPRYYVVFEITRGKSKGTLKDKLLQLERDVTFLLERKRPHLKDKLSILDIVGNFLVRI